ncbi:MAG TPA: hypothetical protein PLT68_12265 [Actinomycetota bacterium]|nr:hypothetical protein [Actinomycetota bacterium]
MHPFYGPSARFTRGSDPHSAAVGLVSMAAYLAFWAVAIAVAKRELDARFPRADEATAAELRRDPAMTLLRERYARGEIDDRQYTTMRDLLARPPRRPA